MNVSARQNNRERKLLVDQERNVALHLQFVAFLYFRFFQYAVTNGLAYVEIYGLCDAVVVAWCADKSLCGTAETRRFVRYSVLLFLPRMMILCAEVSPRRFVSGWGRGKGVVRARAAGWASSYTRINIQHAMRTSYEYSWCSESWYR